MFIDRCQSNDLFLVSLFFVKATFLKAYITICQDYDLCLLGANLMKSNFFPVISQGLLRATKTFSTSNLTNGPHFCVKWPCYLAKIICNSTENYSLLRLHGNEVLDKGGVLKYNLHSIGHRRYDAARIVVLLTRCCSNRAT